MPFYSSLFSTLPLHQFSPQVPILNLRHILSTLPLLQPSPPISILNPSLIFYLHSTPPISSPPPTSLFTIYLDVQILPRWIRRSKENINCTGFHWCFDSRRLDVLQYYYLIIIISIELLIPSEHSSNILYFHLSTSTFLPISLNLPLRSYCIVFISLLLLVLTCLFHQNIGSLLYLHLSTSTFLPTYIPTSLPLPPSKKVWCTAILLSNY